MKHPTVAVLFLVSMTSVGVAWAHHSIDADFTVGSEKTINVVATEFRFINPHPYVTATETNPTGEVTEWRLLLDDRWEMVESGFTRTTIQPGDELVVNGRPSRRDPTSLYVRVLERPSDGFIYEEDDGEDYDDDDGD